MALYCFLADCQTYSGSWIFFSVMQTLKERKYSLKIFRRYADAVIVYKEDRLSIFFTLLIYFDARVWLARHEFCGIIN